MVNLDISAGSIKENKQFKRKIVIVGTGLVGSSYAFTLLNRNLCDELVLIDANRQKAEGEAADLAHGLAFSDSTMDIYAGNYSDCRDASIVVIAAGAAQAVGETRSDAGIITRNSRTIEAIVKSTAESGFEGIFLIATNPVDVMSMIAYKSSGFPASRIIGSGTTLDTARLRFLLGKYFGVDAHNIHAYVIGEHGDSEFVPWSNAFVSTKSTDELCAEHPLRFSKDKLTELEQEVRGSAYKIIAAKQATCYGIGMALARITKAIFEDEHSILTVSSLLEGEYNLGNVWLGTPCILGKEGIYGKLRLKLTDEETEKLKFSANVVAKNYDDALSSIII